MQPNFTPIPTDIARAYQAGGLDANSQKPEHHVSDGSGNPCRHCLGLIPEGQGMLILAHRPFPAPQPYAEVGPIFLCADPCAPGGGPDLPAMLDSPNYIIRGYDADDRIIYGTGGVTATEAIPARASELLRDEKVAYVHVRSARYNCYHVRIDRG